MKKDERMAKFIANVAQGNTGKAVQRLRGLLTSNEKTWFGNRWAEVGGNLRFLAKQLEILADLRPDWGSSYIAHKLMLPSDVACASEWLSVIQPEVDRRARDLLLKVGRG